jgi:hypothetical protein
MNARLFWGLLVPATLFVVPARADDKAACLDAASKGQRLRATHKLVEAREQLQACAALQCPAVVQSDCTRWLADVENALPTLVFAAEDVTGADLVDVTVSADGRRLTSKLDGQAVPLNPGSYTFHFESSGRPSVDRHVLVQEGEKNEGVAVVFEAAVPAPAAPASGVPASGVPASGVPASGVPASGVPASGVPALPVAGAGSAEAIEPFGLWKTLGWALGGVGVVGLAVGAAAGIVALKDKNAAQCDANGVCNPGTVGGIKSAARVSDVGWIAGSVFLAGGAALVLFAPSAIRGATAVATVTVAPVVVPSGGAIMARASF